MKIEKRVYVQNFIVQLYIDSTKNMMKKTFQGLSKFLLSFFPFPSSPELSPWDIWKHFVCMCVTKYETIQNIWESEAIQKIWHLEIKGILIRIQHDNFNNNITRMKMKKTLKNEK